MFEVLNRSWLSKSHVRVTFSSFHRAFKKIHIRIYLQGVKLISEAKRIERHRRGANALKRKVTKFPRGLNIEKKDEEEEKTRKVGGYF